jgi:hypothetical protein
MPFNICSCNSLKNSGSAARNGCLCIKRLQASAI